MNGLSTRDVARWSGATYRQLDHWDREDVLTPSVRRTIGSGLPRVYDPVDAALAAVCADLSTLHASLDVMRAVVDRLRMLDVWPDTITVGVDGRIGDLPGWTVPAAARLAATATLYAVAC